MKLSQRMHDVIWGPWVDDPIAKRNEGLEWLKGVCQLEAENERLREVAVAYQKKIDDDCASSGCLCTFRGVPACSEWIAKALRGE